MVTSAQIDETKARILTGKPDAKEIEGFISNKPYAEIEYGVTPEGTRQYLQVLERDLYDSSDSPLGGRITTKDGLEAYAWDTGSHNKVILKDGSEYSSYICPSDMDGETLSNGSLSIEEVKTLESTYDKAIEIAYSNNIPGVEDMPRSDQFEVLSRRIVESRDADKIAAKHRVNNFLNHTEFGDQFVAYSADIADDGKRATIQVAVSFEMRGRKYEKGESVRIDSNTFDIIDEWRS